MILLLHPPVAKPSEPPAGIAQLTGILRGNDIPCHAADLNLEALYSLFAQANSGSDTWSKRSYNNLKRNLEMVRRSELYANFSRYQKCVLELNRILEIQGNPRTTLSLANFQDASCSPVCSDDLLRIAREAEKSVFFPFLERTIPALIDEHQPRYIGISINYLSQAVTSFALLGYLRQIRPDIKTIVGGGLITSWMRKPNWNNPFHKFIDHCVDGCGETFLLNLFGKKRQLRLSPDYDPFVAGKYFAPGFILPYSCSTGCYWNKCDFCPERAEGNHFFAKDVDRVLTEIRVLREQHQPALLHLLDNAIPPAILRQFSKDIPNMPWYGFVRLTHHFLDLGFCRNLRRSGCTMLKIGIESG
ncbi:MAG: radical SAM protein, partial [Desulfocapsaceae bacterium]|nr:radical SAM protein [Desulfocapsaceae bacterium]